MSAPTTCRHRAGVDLDPTGWSTCPDCGHVHHADAAEWVDDGLVAAGLTAENGVEPEWHPPTPVVDPYAGVPSVGEQLAATVAAARSAPAPFEDPQQRYEPLDWATVWAGTTNEPDWLVEDLIERGRSHALTSAAKAGKSLLTLDVVAALVAHRPILGRPNPHPGPITVLYVDLENAAADLRQRLEAMGYGPADLGRLVYYSFPSLPALDSEQGGRHLCGLVARHEPELVVLDTVSRFIGGEENSADTFRLLYRYALAPIKANGIAVLRLDHLGKDPTSGPRGSSAKADDVDTSWLLANLGDGYLRLRLDRQRSGHHPEQIDLQRRTLDTLRHVRVDQPQADPAVAAAIRDLDRLQVPLDHGRDRARKTLADAGVKVRNDVLTRALSTRREGLDLSRTGPGEVDQPKIDFRCPEEMAG